MKTGAAILFPLLLALWAGVIVGVSLIATPVKFQAPSLTIPVGLEIGRYTFRVFSRVEIGFLIAAVVLAAVVRPRWSTLLLVTLVVVQIGLQRYWLLPALDSRVADTLAGRPPAPSIHHTVFAVMEAAKAALLLAAAAIQSGFIG